MATVTEALHSPEELLAMTEGPRYELVDGRLVERHMGAKSSLIAANLVTVLNQFPGIRQLGLVFAPDCGYQIFPGRPNLVRFPDVSFIPRARLPGGQLPEGHARVVPGLVVEVVSPNDLAVTLEEKVDNYLSASVPLIWVIYPSTRRVMVYRLSGECSRVGPSEEIGGEDVLPGFTCRVEELFAGIPAEPAS